ncbi:cytosolic endo-beta-N-acetylglucosaminidase-like protein [Leptotrombidium deliense]|uniref:Cytosolic endo-beta-N-acetylglucosaminidase n=1 Tax=Leptotrombidium deliense TaxID=299467 RepID=A0A443SUV0_9ACAR|nr:cytosolic endo-beta-N-acetylglucosaminidase-like protein [Leptotrombidium deliense]
MKQLHSSIASELDLLSFHTKEYIDHIKLLTDRVDQGEDVSTDLDDEYGLSYDCQPIAHLYKIICEIAGSTLTAAKAICSGECRIAINWFGGWHHAQRDEASGYCYVNDITIAVLHLLSNGFKKVLYVDLDLHHGDAVEAAFGHTDKVMTVSLHKFETGFFPGSGSICSNKSNCVNVPLRDGIDDKTYFNVFCETLKKVKQNFAADIVICQCGGDTLFGDPMNSFNLTVKGVGQCVQFLLSQFECPFIFVGGGGYNVLNVSRLWTYLTSVIIGVPLENEIPDHSNFLLYRPSYELHTESGNRRNLNDECYIRSVLKSETESEIFSAIPAITESVPVDGPKVLLCHDMKGGYLDDRFLAGSDKFDSYTFFHWSHIDLFVYFSHHLVTIPPITWTTAAHRNGVPMLGTFITEGDKGRDVCQQMLSSQNMIMNTVKQLVNICSQCKFEGWLINVENAIRESDVPALLQFVALLTESMHERIPGSKVIWYDSVIYPSGCVSWQNELNLKNSSFFDACDGIYLNYSWSTESLQKSVEFGEQCNRKYDIYVGIDVFGRGCYGGGGMNTNLAVNVIKDFDLSMAIFAPGWVHEILGSKNFHENQLKFWSSLNLPVRRLLSCLPLQTSFCRGFGKMLFKHGVVYNSEPWSNLLSQDIQILPDAPFCVEDGFEGGGCLLVSSECHLLNCQIIVPMSGCVIILVYKPIAQMSTLKITVSEMENNDAEHPLVYLSPIG